MKPLFAGDLCPKCGWILTWLDFGYGRCGHCLNAEIPLRRDLPPEFAQVIAHALPPAIGMES